MNAYIVYTTVTVIFARLHLLHKTSWVEFTLGSPDWTVQLDYATVHGVPARMG